MTLLVSARTWSIKIGGNLENVQAGDGAVHIRRDVVEEALHKLAGG
jgi:hypothetical protein